MKVPRIDIFSSGDFDSVVAMLEAEGLDAPRSQEDVRGLALVARDDDGSVCGFIWALAAEGCETAFVDYFALRRDVRKTATGVFLLGALVVFLRKLGVTRIKAVVPQRMHRYLKLLERRGSRNLGLHHFLVADLVVGGG